MHICHKIKEIILHADPKWRPQSVALWEVMTDTVLPEGATRTWIKGRVISILYAEE